MALMISEAMNCYAADRVAKGFAWNPGCTPQKRYFSFAKTVSGHAIYCVAVKRCRRSRNNADPVRSGISKTPIKKDKYNELPAIRW